MKRLASAFRQLHVASMDSAARSRSQRLARPGMIAAVLLLLSIALPAQQKPVLVASTNPAVPGKLTNSITNSTPTNAPSSITGTAAVPYEPTHLFNGSDFEQFYPWLAGAGTFVDSKGVFSVQDGMLCVSGERQGHLATKDMFADYRLTVEYKWGEKRFGDLIKGRNSGIFVHATGHDALHMRSIECQIAEGRTGEVVLMEGAKLTVGETNRSKAWSTFPRSTGTNEVEKARGEWNTMVILCEGSRLQVKVNDVVTVEGTNAVPNRGKILLQSNGSEIFFRKIELQPLPRSFPRPLEAVPVTNSTPSEVKTNTTVTAK
ncbi:MAG TPA: DUF1080 domain-containing protein [Roseimicrobium sp.]|nr:DUF1080 domain-containing protein [Roseimicrobium sp.]